ncbi:T9SS type A sorting domain-containing protein [candidate division KSB1 bacterium]|nr:T9SS type A sorting domain-containing protein [candidate division KSB1 bacterium]
MKILNEKQIRPSFGRIFTALLLLHMLSAELHSQWSKDAAENNVIVKLENDQSRPAVISDAEGGAVIVWQDGRNGDFDIYASRIFASGNLTWTRDGEPIAIAEKNQEFPTIVRNVQGGAFIAWRDSRDASIFDTPIGIYAQRIDDSFGQGQWEQNGNLVHLPVISTSPSIIQDRNFGPIVATYTPTESSFFSLLIQKLGINGEPEWTPLTPRNKNPRISSPAPQEPPVIVSDLSGGVIFSWADMRNANLALYVSHLSTEDTLDWPSGEVLIDSVLTPGTTPAMVSDDSKGIIIAWISPDIPDSKDFVKAQRVNSLGEPQWEESGRVISSSAGRKRNVKIVQTSQDTLIILWENLNADWDIAAKRINSTGIALESEIDVASAVEIQTNPSMIADGRGGAIVVWEDERNTNSSSTDIYAQLIKIDGGLGWGEDGTAVSTAAEKQTAPVLASDGLGGAIIIWEDLRNGSNNADIYGQRVSAPGVLGEFREINITSPNSNDNWEISGPRRITWMSQGEIENVKIELSRDGGATYSTLVATTPDTGSYVWPAVLGPPSTECKVIVRDVKADFILDVSDGLFTISEPAGPALDTLEIKTIVRAGEAIEITTIAKDLSGVKDVFLNYKLGGAVTFRSAKMVRQDSDQYRGTIPADSVTERGVEFFVRGFDNIDLSSVTDTSFVQVPFPAGVQTTDIFAGSAQTAYRMISAPNLLDETLADSIFSNSRFGAYDTTSWRLFKYRNGQTIERDSANSDSFNFTPGEAFWLISSRNRTIDFGPGISQRADMSAIITLAPGWNQVGNPFAFSVAWDSVIADGNVDDPIFYNGIYSAAQNLEPYQGYFLWNFETREVALTIPPIEANASNPILSRTAAGVDWQVQILSMCSEARDDFNYLGIHEQASITWDRFDHPEPPPIGEYISVYFPKKDWQVYPNNYTTDYRDDLGQGQSWTFQVKTNIPNTEAQILFSGLADLPWDLEIVLVDEKLNITRDLLVDQSYSFPTGNSGTTKTLKVIVGKREYISDEISRSTFIPSTFELDQNFPNPFNPATSIRYGLPEAANVTIKVFDLLGKEVVTLLSAEQREAGYHVISWGGRDRDGSSVASGLYFYQIISGKFVQTRKMLLVK